MHDLHDTEDRYFNIQQEQLETEILNLRKIMAHGPEIIQEFRTKIQRLNLEYLEEHKREPGNITRGTELITILREIIKGTNIQI